MKPSKKSAVTYTPILGKSFANTEDGKSQAGQYIKHSIA